MQGPFPVFFTRSRECNLSSSQLGIQAALVRDSDGGTQPLPSDRAVSLDRELEKQVTHCVSGQRTPKHWSQCQMTSFGSCHVPVHTPWIWLGEGRRELTGGIGEKEQRKGDFCFWGDGSVSWEFTEVCRLTFAVGKTHPRLPSEGPAAGAASPDFCFPGKPPARAPGTGYWMELSKGTSRRVSVLLVFQVCNHS